LALEDRITQEQCLALLLEHYDFMRGVKGVENASLEYFGDSLNHLNEDQHIELIMMVKNPSLYDKTRRPDIFQAEFERLKNRLENS
jgi:membrane peptidoglycan carboxypeptidase